jgi:hypothetical protein
MVRTYAHAGLAQPVHAACQRARPRLGPRCTRTSHPIPGPGQMEHPASAPRERGPQDREPGRHGRERREPVRPAAEPGGSGCHRADPGMLGPAGGRGAGQQDSPWAGDTDDLRWAGPCARSAIWTAVLVPERRWVPGRPAEDCPNAHCRSPGPDAARPHSPADQARGPRAVHRGSGCRAPGRRGASPGRPGCRAVSADG